MTNNKTYTKDPIKSLYFAEYQKIGGMKNFKEYCINSGVFIDHTIDIFCYGDPIKYNSREDSFTAVKKILGIDTKEINLIFHSIDGVTSYT